LFIAEKGTLFCKFGVGGGHELQEDMLIILKVLNEDRDYN
jgi:hypothetical protein